MRAPPRQKPPDAARAILRGLSDSCAPRPPASDPEFFAPLRSVAEHPARACNQIQPILRDAGVIMNTKLYVGNLPYDTSDTELQTLFQGVGAVNSVSLVRDRATGQPRGFAFVEMSDAEGARRAVA